MPSDAAIKVMGVMTKIWDYQPTDDALPAWERHAEWLAQAIRERRSTSEMDEYMSRAQALLKMRGSMDFRKIVDRSVEALAVTPSPSEASRIEKLNPVRV